MKTLPIDFKKEDERFEEKLNAKIFLTELYGLAFIGKFENHILQSVPSAKDKNTAIAIYSKHIKDNYDYFVTKNGWWPEEFKTVVWNIALEDSLRPFAKKTYEDMFLRYYRGDLVEPPENKEG